MVRIEFKTGSLAPEQQSIATSGLASHTETNAAPPYEKTTAAWLAYDDEEKIVGVVTIQLLWDWIYVDELFVKKSQRGTGLGQQLMEQVESYARNVNAVGIWLWTQSWQAEGFYKKVGYSEFSRFPDFPKGHERIGLRKILTE